MFKKLRRELKRSAPTRYNRILGYIYNLKSSINFRNSTDKQIVEDIEKITERIIKKVKVYSRINVILYIAIYFSFISFFFGDVFLLSDIANLLNKILSIFGTTIFILGIYFSQKIIELYYQDLNLITSHLISIYTKHQREAIDELKSPAVNTYEVFIEFFKERYPEE